MGLGARLAVGIVCVLALLAPALSGALAPRFATSSWATALALAAAGAGVILSTYARRRAAMGAGALVLVVVLVAGAFGAAGASVAAVTAIGLALLGAALILAHVHDARARRAGRALAIFAALLPFVRALGALYGVGEATPFERFWTAMHPQSALSLLVLAAPLVVLHAGDGAANIVRGTSLAGLFARRVFPAVVVVPAAIGFTVLLFQKSGLFGDEEGFALFAFATSVVFGAVAWWTSSALLRSETMLRHSEARYARLRDSGLLGIIVAELGGPILEANEAFQKMTGYGHDEIAARKVHTAMLATEDIASRREGVIAHLRQTGVTRIEPGELKRKDGSRIPVLMGTALLDEGKAIAFQLDRTSLLVAEEARAASEAALKSAEEQLRQAQKLEAVGRLAGGIAHDFNNLLSVILGCADFVAKAMEHGDPLRADVGEIQRAGERAAALTRQLLAFSRRQVLQPRVVDLNDVVGATISMLERLIGEHIQLDFVPGAAIDKVKLDPGQVEQILINLVVNARDAMPDGGTITIATENIVVDAANAHVYADVARGAHVMLSIADTGVGMDQDTQSRIFEPFFTTKGVGAGTGLGLASVFGVVKQSGGGITVVSTPGKGTSFKLLFPRVTADDTAASRTAAEPAAASAPRRASRGTETILVVEDEATLRLLAKRILEHAGYRVLVAEDGPAALALSRAHEGELHLLLTDIVMPRMNGRELARQLVGERPRLKTVFMSGYTDDEILRHGILAAGLPFIEKPIVPASLLQMVREVLDR